MEAGEEILELVLEGLRPASMLCPWLAGTVRSFLVVVDDAVILLCQVFSGLRNNV